MNGKAVFKAAVEKMTESGREVLEKVGLKRQMSLCSSLIRLT